jgi:hypothetical protein
MLNNGFVHHLFDLKTKDMMHIYYAAKNRHGRSLDDREAFIAQVIHQLHEHVTGYDFVVCPQSSSDLIERIVTGIGAPFIIVEKNSIEYLRAKVDSLGLQRAEKGSHLERISNMEDSFKINSLKATQRVKYEDFLFKKTDVPQGVGLIFDDSCFSGTTFRALRSATGATSFLSIFAK